MKYLLSLLFLLFANLSNGQQTNPFRLTDNQLAKLKYDILQVANDATKQYQVRRLNEITMVDTTRLVKGYATIDYSGSNGKVLQIQTQRGEPCGDIIVTLTFYNKTGLKEYVENRSCSESIGDTTTGQFAYYSGKEFFRYEYDSQQRLQKEVTHIPGSRLTSRIIVTYGADGKPVTVRSRIKKEEFWD